MKSSIRKSAARLGLAAAALAAAWLVPPAFHGARHLCPVRPDGVSQAQALPAFSRKYGISCSQCHYAYPVLNAYGRQFKMNGYVREKGSADGVLKSADAQLWLEKVFPWAVIVRSRPFDDGRGTVANAGTQMGATSNPNPNGFKAQPINDIDMFVAGGDPAKHVSYFGELDANMTNGFTPAMGDLRLGYHPFDFANVILARRGFFADDPYQTIVSNESPTIANRATDMLMADQSSISGSQLLAAQQMAAVNGQVDLGRTAFLYYAAGATKDNDQGRQGNAPTNGDVRLAFDDGKGLMVGAFGSYGHTGPFATCAAGGSCPGLGFTNFTDRQQFVRGGFDALYERGDLSARGAFLYQHDEDPVFKGATATDRAAYAELSYAYRLQGQDYPFLMPLIRQNWYTTGNGKQQFSYVTAHLAHYFAPNVKAFVEGSWDTRKAYQGASLAPTGVAGNGGTLAMRGSRATAQLEVGF